MAVYGAQGGVPMHIKAWLNMTSVGVGEILASGTLAVFFSLTFSLLTQKQHPIMGYTRTKSCIINSGTKRENILRLALSDDATSFLLCYLLMG